MERHELIKILQSFVQIQEGEKYYIGSRSSSRVGALSFLYRNLYSETREATTAFIRETITQFSVETDVDRELLRSARAGIKRLATAYVDDPATTEKFNKLDALVVEKILASPIGKIEQQTEATVDYTVPEVGSLLEQAVPEASEREVETPLEAVVEEHRVEVRKRHEAALRRMHYGGLPSFGYNFSATYH